MCDASTMAQGALGLQVGGVLSSAYGSYQKAQGEKQALEYQAKVAKNNAMMAEWQASDALRRGTKASAAHAMKVAAAKGSQRAALAARGVDLGDGSALNILTDTDLMGAIDTNTLLDNAGREAWGARVSGANSSANADLLRSRASSISPFGSATSTLLTGAANVGGSWYKLSKDGVFGTKRSYIDSRLTDSTP